MNALSTPPKHDPEKLQTFRVKLMLKKQRVRAGWMTPLEFILL